ncbi:hypothetical protein [Methanobrevibacter curvatus]|nr:hypothetical protein [Methanobrevibacter curvatus]
MDIQNHDKTNQPNNQRKTMVQQQSNNLKKNKPHGKILKMYIKKP